LELSVTEETSTAAGINNRDSQQQGPQGRNENTALRKTATAGPTTAQETTRTSGTPELVETLITTKEY
jgi:hypothetical protein